MKVITRSILILLFAKFALNFELDDLRPVSVRNAKNCHFLNLTTDFCLQRNKVFLEKVICKVQHGSKIDKYGYLVKYIDRTHLKIDVWGNVTEPINSIKTRSTIYYKHNTYQRFGGDINISICDLLTEEKRSPLLDFVFVKLTKYSNLNPYNGYAYYKADNVSIDEFAYPYMMPAGRYRIDVSVFEDIERVLFNTSIYFSISDHRIDVSKSVISYTPISLI